VRKGELLEGAAKGFGTRLAAVADRWSAPTPDDEWDVRALVNHVTGELLWLVPMLEGKTIADVGSALDGDILGDDPVTTWDDAVSAAAAAIQAVDAAATVHLSYGDRTAEEYLFEVGADVLIHTWDLARAVGADERLDPAFVDSVAAWFADVEPMWRGAGVIAERPPVPSGADAQTQLLAAFGRDASA
jgi:uncharacterized protein (TIGR03086 family)